MRTWLITGSAVLFSVGVAVAEDLQITPNAPIQDFQNRQEDVKPYNFDAPPEGLFREIQLAEGFEEELGFRRSHEIIPVTPTTVFTSNAPVFVVFKVHQHYEPYQVFGVCYPEDVPGLDSGKELAQDAMLLALEDESGYVKLDAPPGGWKPGRYKVNIHVGWKINDITLLGVMRFTVPEDQGAPHAAVTGDQSAATR
ncbi:hypothetical protein [Candidatus Nitrospira bockiana]